jgi:flagellar hook-associated protein 1
VSDLLRIAVSGLVANQGSLNTTGHNIANVGVEGYSRQRVELDTRVPQLRGGAYFGSGVNIETVGRFVNEFVTSQLRSDSSSYNAADTLRFYTEQLDNLFGSASSGLSGGLNDLFGALQTAADDPISIASRQVVIGEASDLTRQFNTVYQRLDDINASLNTQLSSLAKDMSALAANIASLNTRIETAIGASGAADQPNDLLDQRDQALLQLAAIADISTIREGNSINVFLGKGQALVVGPIVNPVIAVPGRFDPARSELAIVVSGETRPFVGDITGGKVGGLLDFRARVLDQAYNQMGRVAIGLAADMNAQHQLGMDLEGDLGGLLFNDPNGGLSPTLRARAAADNDPLSTGVVMVKIDDPALLTTSGYQLDILSGGAWRLYRIQDAQVVGTGASLSDPLIAIDGFSLNLNLPAANFVAGDSFLIEPTRRGARDIGLAITRPEDLALAQPVRAAPLGGNLGSAGIAVTEVFDTSLPLFSTTAGALAPPLLLRFSSATSFDVLDNSDPANPVDLVPPVTGLSYSPGVSNVLFSTDPLAGDYFGFQLRMDGNPAAGDRFALSYNTGGVSDNRNARALAGLQTADTLDNGRVSYEGAVRSLVGFIGVETRSARTETSSAELVLNQTRASRDQYSGVNLDEEAANLVRFEQAYQAMAQVIATARLLMDTILEATR